MALADMWTLTTGWYGDRLAENYSPRPVSELQQLLDDVGLTGEFWRLGG